MDNVAGLLFHPSVRVREKALWLLGSRIPDAVLSCRAVLLALSESNKVVRIHAAGAPKRWIRADKVVFNTLL